MSATFVWLQKEEKIRLLRQRLAEREASTKNSSGNLEHSDANPTAITPNIAQGKDALLIIQADPTTTSDFDSAIGGGLSIVTRASQSDVEFSESYLWDGDLTTDEFRFNWNAPYFIHEYYSIKSIYFFIFEVQVCSTTSSWAYFIWSMMIWCICITGQFIQMLNPNHMQG